MWIDTHTHFDFPIFDSSRADDWARAQSLGVSAQFVMGVEPRYFQRVAELATCYPQTYFALGIHPLFIHELDFSQAIAQLRQMVATYREHPRFIGLGEIGLDAWDKSSDIDRQMTFFEAQLAIAREWDLPVFMHSRKAQDKLLKCCRKLGVKQGIVHAFSGSQQQAEHCLSQGFKLGFGGALTYERAKRLRRLVVDLPIEAFVLETDAPDMSPAWCFRQTNYSYHLPKIAEVFATLRRMSLEEVSTALWQNSQDAIGKVISKPRIRLKDGS